METAAAAATAAPGSRQPASDSEGTIAQAVIEVAIVLDDSVDASLLAPLGALGSLPEVGA